MNLLVEGERAILQQRDDERDDERHDDAHHVEAHLPLGGAMYSK